MQAPLNLNLRRFRAFLLLNLRDVEYATGVSADKLSKAERGLIQLNEAEQRALESYYQARYKMAVGGQPANLTLGE
jgi:hypothetical protein